MKINPATLERTTPCNQEKRNLLDVPAPWPKAPRSFNWQLIPKKLQALAIAGIHYDDRVIN